MADETWTLEALKEYFDRRLEDLKELLQQNSETAKVAVDAALAAAKEAVAAALTSAKEAGSKAEQLTTERISAHNEHQARFDRAAATFATKDWAISQLDARSKEHRDLEARVARTEANKAGMTAGVKMLIGAAGFLLTLFGIAAALGTFYAFIRR